MSEFGYQHFSAMGHNPGALHRICLDHPLSGEKVVLLDMLLTLSSAAFK
jgi:hypothetical protein